MSTPQPAPGTLRAKTLTELDAKIARARAAVDRRVQEALERIRQRG